MGHASGAWRFVRAAVGATFPYGEYLHRRLALGPFARRFQLADHVKVAGATLADGLLIIDFVRELPEEVKPRRIEIGTAGSAVASGIVWLWLVVLLMVLLVLTVTRFSVTIDARGVNWRSALGFPRGGVALADITSVAAVDVRPGDFGGYGLRFMPRRKGIITRAGRALQIDHGTGTLVITVDDADTAASVVEGLRLRRAG